jgi:hypothetical protein
MIPMHPAMVNAMTFPFRMSEAFWTVWLQVYAPKGK